MSNPIILKRSSDNWVLNVVDATQVAGEGQALRQLGDGEVSNFDTLWAAGPVIDDVGGLRAATSTEILRLKPLKAQLVAVFQAVSDVNTRAMLAPLAAGVLAAVANKDLAAAKAVISNTTNPGGSALSSDQFSTLQSDLLACFPS